MVSALVFFTKLDVHKFGFAARSQGIQYEGINTSKCHLLSLATCKRVCRHMEILYREQRMIDKDLHSIILPAENIVELIPFVLLLLQEQHGVYVPVYLEVLVISKSGKQNSLISFNRWFDLSILLSRKFNCFSLSLK